QCRDPLELRAPLRRGRSHGTGDLQGGTVERVRGTRIRLRAIEIALADERRNAPGIELQRAIESRSFRLRGAEVTVCQREAEPGVGARRPAHRRPLEVLARGLGIAALQRLETGARQTGRLAAVLFGHARGTPQSPARLLVNLHSEIVRRLHLVALRLVLLDLYFHLILVVAGSNRKTGSKLGGGPAEHAIATNVLRLESRIPRIPDEQVVRLFLRRSGGGRRGRGFCIRSRV